MNFTGVVEIIEIRATILSQIWIIKYTYLLCSTMLHSKLLNTDTNKVRNKSAIEDILKVDKIDYSRYIFVVTQEENIVMKAKLSRKVLMTKHLSSFWEELFVIYSVPASVIILWIATS